MKFNGISECLYILAKIILSKLNGCIECNAPEISSFLIVWVFVAIILWRPEKFNLIRMGILSTEVVAMTAIFLWMDYKIFLDKMTNIWFLRRHPRQLNKTLNHKHECQTRRKHKTRFTTFYILTLSKRPPTGFPRPIKSTSLPYWSPESIFRFLLHFFPRYFHDFYLYIAPPSIISPWLYSKTHCLPIVVHAIVGFSGVSVVRRMSFTYVQMIIY